MGKDPAFPFYASDYLVDTMRWTRAMKSLHVDLIAESWANEKIEDNNGCPVGLSDEDRETWKKIEYKWKLVDGVWINEKLEKVRADRKYFKEQQSIRGKKSAQKRNQRSTSVQPDPNHGSTNVEPVESESEKENEIKKNNKEPKVFEYTLKPDLGVLIEEKLSELDEIYLDAQAMKWPHLDFQYEYRTFCEKVRGSPDFYKDHQSIRLAFQKQLRESKNRKNGKGFNNKNDRTDFTSRELEIIKDHIDRNR